MQIHHGLVKRMLFSFLAIGLSFNLVFPSFIFAELQDVVDSKDNENIFIYIGDLVTVKVHSLTRIAVSNPAYVDVTNATADEIVLIGRKVGETPIFIWDEYGKRRIVARVLADDLGLISQRIASLIQSAGIKGVSFEKNYYEGKLVLSGRLTKDDKKLLDDTIKEFNAYLINMVKVEGDLIEIDVQISELSKTLTQALGLDWTGGSSTTGISLAYPESLPASTGKFADLFKLGDFNRASAIQATVNAIINEGKGRVLSKPSIVVTNGEEASFNVGGEIPIRTTTTATAGVTQENVSFKSYGIDLNVTPEIKDGKIDIKMDVQIRDIDSANAVGDNVAFTTRKASTRLVVQDGQLIVLAGLIKRNKSESIKRVPFISRIPVVGLLFRSYSTPSANTDLELVISLRPKIYGKDQVSSAKTKSIASPSEGIKASEELSKGISREEVGVAMDSMILGKKNKVSDGKSKEKNKAAEVKVSPVVEKKDKDNSKKALKEVVVTKDKQKNNKNDALLKKSTDDKKVEVKTEKVPVAAKAPVAVKPVVVDKPASAQVSFSAKVAAVKDTTTVAKDEDFIAMEETKIAEPQNVLTDAEIAQLKTKYTDLIKKEMMDTISYPYEAKEYGWEGTVVLDMTLRPDGNVKSVNVGKTSGRAIFDKDAVNTATILAPYDSFKPAKNLRELTVSVPIEYTEKAMFGSK